jgi:DNA-binding CsgD family transcriptional regulator
MTMTDPDVHIRRAPVLYGRDAELGVLLACLADAAAGHGGLVLVGGEAGIGKTALVEALAAEAGRQGALVLSGQCYDLATTPPYGPWIEILSTPVPQSQLAEAPSLLADDPTASPSTQDAQFARLRAFFTDAAERQPLLLLLEDQHWADPASLALLRFLARAVRDLALLIVVTYRDAELTAQYPLYRYLPQLVREARAVRVSLRRLPRDAIRALVADRFTLTADDEARLVDYLQRYAEGNPFFTEELLRSLEHDQILSPAGHGWTLGNLAEAQVPLLVRQVIDAHIAWLPDDVQRFLQIAAVIGVEVPLSLWREVAELSDEALSTVVEQAAVARLLDELPGRGGLRFSHALMREALYDGTVLPRRRAWHRRIAEVLAGRPDADPDTVAHHFQQAGDRRAAQWLIQAGERAGRANAVQDAVERYEQALRLLEHDATTAGQRGWLLCNLAEAYRYSDPRHALEYLDLARQCVDEAGDVALAAIVLWSRARIRGFLGENTIADLNQAVAAFDALSDADRQRVLALGRGYAGSQGPLAQWLAHHGRFEDARRIAAASLVDDSDDLTPRHRSEVGHAYFGLGLAHAGLGRPDEALTALERARQHFSGAGNSFMAAAALKWALVEVALIYMPHDLAQRRRLVDDYARIWLQTSSFATYIDGRPLLPLYQELILDGQWQAAQETASAYLGTPFLRVDSLAALGELERNQGLPSRAWSRVQQGILRGPDTEPGNPFFIRTLALQRLAAELALDEGQLDLARQWIDAHDRWLAWSDRVPDRAAGLLLWARLDEAHAALEHAVERASRALALAAEPRQPVALIAAHRALGRLESRRRRFDAAGAHLDEAVALADACAAPYERALTLLERAELLAATGRADEAHPLVDDVRATCEPLQAQPALARAAALQERLPRGTRPASTISGLSAREVEVLQLVARGLTDAEVGQQLFISPRTVSRHLQSIYNKLAVNSRTAATAFAFEHDLV